jgi:hypothetical protein
MAAAMVHTVGEPIERKQHPRTAYEAKFSVPYTFASALLGGAGLGLAFPTSRMPRIAVAADARYETILRATCTGRRVRTHQGWQAVERRGPRQSREPRATPLAS